MTQIFDSIDIKLTDSEKLEVLSSYVEATQASPIPFSYYLKAFVGGLDDVMRQTLSYFLPDETVEAVMATDFALEIIKNKEIVQCYRIADTVIYNGFAHDEIKAQNGTPLTISELVNSLKPLSADKQEIKAIRLLHRSPHGMIPLKNGIREIMSRQATLASIHNPLHPTMFYKTEQGGVVYFDSGKLTFVPTDLSEEVLKSHEENVATDNSEYWKVSHFNI